MSNLEEKKGESKQEIKECEQEILELKRKIAGFQCEIEREIKDYDYTNNITKEIENKKTFNSYKILEGHFQKIHYLNYSNSNMLATIGGDNKIIIWSENGNKKCVITTEEWASMICKFSPDSQFIASGGLDNSCTLFKLVTETDKNGNVFIKEGQSSYELGKHDGCLNNILFKSNTELITCSGDSNIWLWDIESESVISEYNLHKKDVMDITNYNERNNNINNNDNNYFISCSVDGTIKVWDLRMNKKNNKSEITYYFNNIYSNNNNNITINKKDNEINCLRFLDEYSFVAGNENGKIKMFDIRSQKCLNIYKTPKYKLPIYCIEFSKSGYFMFCATDAQNTNNKNNVLIFNTLNTSYHSHLSHNKRVSSIRLSANKDNIATSCWDTNAYFWK